MRRGESALAYARHIRADSQYLRAAAATTRRRSQALRVVAGQASSLSSHLRGRLPYADVVGTRTGAPVRLVVRQDGTVDSPSTPAGRPAPGSDPLGATLAAARACERVSSVSFRRAGQRAAVPQLALLAQLGSEGGHLAGDHVGDHVGGQVGGHVGGRSDDQLARLLFDAGLVATSLLRATADPLLRRRVGELVATLDDAVATLRSRTFTTGPGGDDRTPPAA